MCVCGASVRVRVHAWVACLGVHAWVFTCMLHTHTHMQRVYVWSFMYVTYVSMHALVLFRTFAARPFKGPLDARLLPPEKRLPSHYLVIVYPKN